MIPSDEQAKAITAIPFLRDNYAWAHVADGAAYVVDPGEAAPVIEWLQRSRAALTAILLTHHHGDHVGGVAELKRHWPAALVYGPADARVDGIDVSVRGGDRIGIPSPHARFEVIDLPGHTATHIAFHGEGLLFCGDTLFSAGCGRLFEGTPAQMLASLDALAALPGGTRVCCGHEYTQDNCRFALEVEPGNGTLRAYADDVAALRARSQPTLPALLSREREVNPFLRIDAPGVRGSLVASRNLSRDASRVEAFASLRAWKDVHRA